MAAYKIAKTRVRVDTELSKKLEVKMRMHKRSVLHSIFAGELDVVR